MKKTQYGLISTSSAILIAVLIVGTGLFLYLKNNKNNLANDNQYQNVRFATTSPYPTTSVKKNTQNQEVWKNKEVLATYNGIKIQTFINKSSGNEFDLLLLFNGTTATSENNAKSALKISELGGSLQVTKPNLMTASVVYDANAILNGGKIPVETAEAALLWFKNNAEKELGVKINKIYLLGHSQGGYVVIKLNSQHKVDGVVANAPGPIDFKFRCQLEERNPQVVEEGSACTVMRNLYGDTTTNPSVYEQRSLIYNLPDMKSPMMILQGLDDTKLQVMLMPKLMQELKNCTACQKTELIKIEGVGHWTFDNAQARNSLIEFLKSH